MKVGRIDVDSRNYQSGFRCTNIENQGDITMDVREKLVELLNEAFFDYNHGKGDGYIPKNFADHLVANGVTVQEWIPSSEPPTRKDADKYCRVLAMEMGMMELVNYKGPINYPDRFPYWMPLPEPPKEG